MEVRYPRCCGLDIHKKTVVACMLLTEADGTARRFVRTFGTMTADLLALSDTNSGGIVVERGASAQHVW